LAAFYRFAAEHPAVWPALEKQRLEHVKLGSGIVVEFVANSTRAYESILSVRFDRPTQSTSVNGLKYFLLPSLFEEGKLRCLSIPSYVAASLRAFVEQERWKKNWRRFDEVLKKYRIEHLYHFTDTRNLDSIRKHGGLYSWWRCNQKDIEVPAPGGNESSREMDLKRDLQDYVRLGFNTCPPMLHVARETGRIGKHRILQVRPSVIYLRSTLFSHINANDLNARVGGDFEDFDRIRFDIATRRWDGEVEKKVFQAEVLVKGHVPIDLITNLQKP
jgi:hypothetical protein